jgi:hypothetical protein
LARNERTHAFFSRGEYATAFRLCIAQLRGRKKTDVTLQCAITCLPMSIKDQEEEAPHIPLAFVMVAVRETPKEFLADVAAAEMALDYESGVGMWMSAFCAYIEQNGRPQRRVDQRVSHGASAQAAVRAVGDPVHRSKGLASGA